MGRQIVFPSMDFDRRSKQSKAVPKGCLAVKVGLEEEGQRRFVIPITYLSDPRFRRILDQAQEVYGFHTPGPLRIPCSVDDFLHLKWLLEREHSHSCLVEEDDRPAQSSWSIRRVVASALAL